MKSELSFLPPFHPPLPPHPGNRHFCVASRPYFMHEHMLLNKLISTIYLKAMCCSFDWGGGINLSNAQEAPTLSPRTGGGNQGEGLQLWL